MATHGIKIEALTDRMGGVILRPVSKKARKAYGRHMKEMTGRRTYSAYVDEYRVHEDLAPYMPAQKFRDLMNGWSVTFIMDPWYFGHFLGYDAHLVRF